MPPPLTATESRSLQTALEQLRAELGSAVDASAASAAPVDLDAPIGRVSRIDAIQQQSMVQAARMAAKRRLQQVEAALRRHAEDDYGDCLECGNEVGVERLTARPEAPLCLPCQSKSESRQR